MIHDFSLYVNVENARCVVEFDLIDEDVDCGTWKILYNANGQWIEVNDLLSDETTQSILDQINGKWNEIEEQIEESRDYAD